MRVNKEHIGTSTLIHLPGSLWRVFRKDGTHRDYPSQEVARKAAMSETLDERLERLKLYIESTRYALTEDDVRYDYESGRNRYSLENTALTPERPYPKVPR